MPEYFVVRTSTDKKAWILDEIRKGRLRQGWYAKERTSLVGKTGKPVAENLWIANFQAAVPTNAPTRYRTPGFALEKYRELKRMLDIPEGALVVVPKLDADSGDDGFVLARAAKAPGGKGRSRGCYWFDEGKMHQDDYRHVVAVTPESVCIIPRDSSAGSRKVHRLLKSRRSPVTHSRFKLFNEALKACGCPWPLPPRRLPSNPPVRPKSDV